MNNIQNTKRIDHTSILIILTVVSRLHSLDVDKIKPVIKILNYLSKKVFEIPKTYLDNSKNCDISFTARY